MSQSLLTHATLIFKRINFVIFQLYFIIMIIITEKSVVFLLLLVLAAVIKSHSAMLKTPGLIKQALFIHTFALLIQKHIKHQFPQQLVMLQKLKANKLYLQCIKTQELLQVELPCVVTVEKYLKSKANQTNLAQC